MTARHSKVIPKKRKMYSEKELIIRRFHKDVRQFKAWCDKHGVPYSTFDTAEQEDVCVLSKNEYHLHEERKSIIEDDEDYFLNPAAYETWYEEEQDC